MNLQLAARSTRIGKQAGRSVSAEPSPHGLSSRGSTHQWLQRYDVQPGRRIPEDHRHALLLQTLNPDLPFSLRGDIVTPDWLLKNPLEAYEILSAGVIGYLRHSGRERWLVQVADASNACAITRKARNRPRRREISHRLPGFFATTAGSTLGDATQLLRIVIMPASPRCSIGRLLPKRT